MGLINRQTLWWGCRELGFDLGKESKFRLEELSFNIKAWESEICCCDSIVVDDARL
jgi:hypothetical protein